MRLGTVGSKDLPLDNEFGFLTPNELPDGKWPNENWPAHARVRELKYFNVSFGDIHFTCVQRQMRTAQSERGNNLDILV